MGISWLILPFYASDEHLGLLADAYCGAGKFIDDGYNALYCNFKAAAEVRSQCQEELMFICRYVMLVKVLARSTYSPA